MGSGLIAAAATATNAVAAAGVFFATVDVLYKALIQRIALKCHSRFGQIAFFPGIDLAHVAAATEPRKCGDGQQGEDAVFHSDRFQSLMLSACLIWFSSSVRFSGLNPLCTLITLPSGPIKTEVGIPLMA